MKDRYWVWRNVCGIAVRRRYGDPESHRKFARVQFYEMCGFWPAWEMDPVEAPDPRVVRQVKKQYDDWRKRQRRKEQSG